MTDQRPDDDAARQKQAADLAARMLLEQASRPSMGLPSFDELQRFPQLLPASRSLDLPAVRHASLARPATPADDANPFSFFSQTSSQPPRSLDKIFMDPLIAAAELSASMSSSSFSACSSSSSSSSTSSSSSSSSMSMSSSTAPAASSLSPFTGFDKSAQAPTMNNGASWSDAPSGKLPLVAPPWFDADHARRPSYQPQQQYHQLRHLADYGPLATLSVGRSLDSILHHHSLAVPSSPTLATHASSLNHGLSSSVGTRSPADCWPARSAAAAAARIHHHHHHQQQLGLHDNGNTDDSSSSGGSVDYTKTASSSPTGSLNLNLKRALLFCSSKDDYTHLTYLPGLVDGKQKFIPCHGTFSLSDQRRLIIVFVGVRRLGLVPAVGTTPMIRCDSIAVRGIADQVPKFCRKKSNIRGGPNRTQKKVLEEGRILYAGNRISSTFWWLEPCGEHLAHPPKPLPLPCLVSIYPEQPPVDYWYKLSLFVGAVDVVIRCTFAETSSSEEETHWFFDLTLIKNSPVVIADVVRPASTTMLDAESSHKRPRHQSFDITAAHPSYIKSPRID